VVVSDAQKQFIVRRKRGSSFFVPRAAKLLKQTEILIPDRQGAKLPQPACHGDKATGARIGMLPDETARSPDKSEARNGQQAAAQDPRCLVDHEALSRIRKEARPLRHPQDPHEDRENANHGEEKSEGGHHGETPSGPGERGGLAARGDF
jgi:hypothetical protein